MSGSSQPTFALPESGEMLEEFESGIPRQAPPAGSGGEDEEPFRSSSKLGIIKFYRKCYN